MREKLSKSKNVIIIVVCILVIIGCIGYLVYDAHQTKLEWEEYERQKQEILASMSTPSPTPMPTPAPTPTPTPTPLLGMDRVDFAQLETENPDIYAWIQIPDTEIDYPILQSEEDNYYLMRNADGSVGYPGCIYTNKCNYKDFTDCNTVIYGHNMKNGSMFAGLHDFKEEAFFDENEVLYIQTREALHTYTIYGVVTFDDRYIPDAFSVRSADGLMAFDSSIKSGKWGYSNFREDITLTKEDKVVTLSTCIANEGSKRLLLVGMLTDTHSYEEQDG